MKFSKTHDETLSRGFAVTIDQNDINAETENEFQKIGKTAKIAGFRPGKVPRDVLEKRYSVFEDVVRKLVNKSVQEIIKKEKLTPATEPEVQIEKIEKGKDIKYALSIDLMPEIKLTSLSEITLETPELTISEKEVDDTIQQLASRHGKTEPTDEKRPVGDGDVVLIDFEGTVDGTPFEGGTAKDYILELGAGQFLPEFEKALAGMKPGEESKAPVNFPENYQAQALAGKTAEFTISLKAIHKKIPAVIDDEFAQKIGQKDLAQFRQTIENHIAREWEPTRVRVIRRQIFDQIDEIYSFDLPPRLAENEFQAILQEYKRLKKSPEADKTLAKKSDAELEKESRILAERRIRVGMVLAKIGRENSIKVEKKELDNAVHMQAMNHPGKEKEIIRQYQNNPQMLEQLRSPIFEEKVLAFIVGKAKVTKKKATMQELLEIEKQQNDNEITAPKKKTKKTAEKAVEKTAEKKDKKTK